VKEMINISHKKRFRDNC